MLLQLMFDNAKLNIVSCQIASEANNLNLHNPTKKIYISAVSCLRQERTNNAMQRTLVAMLVRS